MFTDKGWAKVAAAGVILVLATAGSSLAGRGPGGPGQGGIGPGDGSGPIHNVTEGTPVTISGTVVSAGYYGQGVEIDTGEDLVTVYGFGPIRYWDFLDVDRPVVGDAVSVDGYEIALSDGSTRIIAVTVTVDEHTIALRDTETGRPLWRVPRGGIGVPSGPGAGMPPGGCWLQSPPGE